MLGIKRLYIYILQTFVPVFFMTFAISLFIILMQFLWKYVEDMVGKGLETHVLAELFTYAALSLVPMALPLAILLASLMTFGNLGERYELLAIKAAGISLLKAMRPLIILMVFICVGAFFFQNNIIPKINVKLRSLMISVRQKSPELDIPEGSFYSGIENYNIFVKTKDKETGTLRDVMIYDVSKGFDNMAVIVCDSAKMKMSSNKDYLQLNLFYGQQFSNFKQSGLDDRSVVRNDKFVPYSRENFKERQVIIPFDANFNRMDESAMDGTQIAKNASQLRASIDSLTIIVDSLNINDRKVMLNYTYLSYRNNYHADTTNIKEENNTAFVYSLDSVMNSLSPTEKTSIYTDAMSRAEANKNDFMFRSISKIDTQKKIRQHNVELQRKFTLSFACLVFFFIGAPLGAIIRKGGLGMPVVVSVILFIIYYIIDNLGYKMARDGVWAVWQGVWLSSFILFPLGVFITYKAINDSALFNADAYRNYYVKVFGDRSLMTVEQLYSNYNKWAKDALKVFAVFIVISAIRIFTKGFIDSTFSVLQWISGILYLFLLIEIFFTRQEFYSRLKEKIEMSNIILNFTIGIPFYCVLYLLQRNKMKKLFQSEQTQKITINI
ncbi:lipopolysaccharide export system permease protein [Dysgonomonas alginatilytica]|uniref:Lipopolysaccharide export system permease protein n=1 Tax=Dysgonomonas alginatilytica TaxID=1605892 RepID=A0A2V3PPL3_9BACT|nr:LptF/LptG family permease [Dysgonomonas alginatilytica]PXV63163.1 lipopolysaccharide export system permease protein [Dysgonomonas alginatilytica]